MEWEMFKVRVTDEDDAGLEDKADLHPLLALRALSQHDRISLVGSRLHLKLLHVVNVKIRRPDQR